MISNRILVFICLLLCLTSCSNVEDQIYLVNEPEVIQVEDFFTVTGSLVDSKGRKSGHVTLFISEGAKLDGTIAVGLSKQFVGDAQIISASISKASGNELLLLIEPTPERELAFLLLKIDLSNFDSTQHKMLLSYLEVGEGF